MEEYNIEASGDWAGKRIDKVLSGYFSDYSRSFIKKLFDDGYIQVNGKASKPSYSVRTGDIFDISVPDPVSIDIEPENIPLDIIYEDDDVILVNKPKGMARICTQQMMEIPRYSISRMQQPHSHHLPMNRK